MVTKVHSWSEWPGMSPALREYKTGEEVLPEATSVSRLSTVGLTTLT